ncbi:acyl-CoA dehydrogenase family protein [Rhodococcus opacus]|uniref:acyl-CoA dehydrogenase family protein n=1 Tax=Rhodococcus opacus TaxID=37919 RepID=UPI00247478A8|nr:acyl-CoA dehydrogenase family protein [Rhodococcus opacus]MDH6291251.1 alkylation response protein AidB-like acyl-CoA dehydrogenase [Rhodococcus opacus]
MATLSPLRTATHAGLPLEPTSDELLLRQSVASISRKYGPDYFQKLSTAGEPPTELWRDLCASGFLGVHLPEEHGGGGAGLSELSAVIEETAAAGVPVLSAIFSAGVNGTILAQHGTAEQKDRWLRPLAEGTAMSSFAITEPDAGTNSFAINTWAMPDGDEFVINGMKYYISGMEEASFLLLVARTGTDERTGRGRLSLFVVDADADGLTRQVIPTALQVPERQSTVYFENVRVSADRVVGQIDHGMKAAFAGINAERLLVSSICTGVGRYALDKAVKYANERSVWGVPIGSHQGVAHPLAESKIALESARLMTARACALYDAGVNPGESSNMAKVLGVDAGLHALDAAIQTHGGNGVALEYQLSNYYFLLRMLKIGPVSKEMVLNFIAEHTLGLPKSY